MAAASASGASTGIQWPVPGSTLIRLTGIDALSYSAIASGVERSCAPATISVG